ncbi:hypothetical protein SEA_DEJAVU_41 [Microbacterium Phage DejaVu]|nr:hypothetical protein LUPINE_38 [Microbacterium phage Lupine]QDH92190.1 hypothetical protein SEA_PHILLYPHILLY_39 [Microbacterium phage PhillyPhilly]QDK03282.1 hypothetical protein SEA_ROMAN_40 [Microbacterium phage Roman]QIG58585.1 minor tail protein [Microbacterium phage Hubbs]UVG34095.1 hypothetical protein SEA_PAVLO_38 [Microbacterium phage Pavlo]WNM66173.1 hypothetical protein SEA_DEJAVU_41 [Microbacterium Phage DejaVu]
MARKDLIQYRRGTAAEWIAANPTLAYGEIGYDLTNNEIRVGDGQQVWVNLVAIGGATEDQIATAVERYFEDHPVPGVTAEYVQEQIQSHREEPTPHTAYDVNIPSLSILFQNGIV